MMKLCALFVIGLLMAACGVKGAPRPPRTATANPVLTSSTSTSS